MLMCYLVYPQGFAILRAPVIALINLWMLIIFVWRPDNTVQFSHAMAPINHVIVFSCLLDHSRCPHAHSSSPCHSMIARSRAHPLSLWCSPLHASCKIFTDNGQFVLDDLVVAAAYYQQVEINITSFQHLLITVTLIAAAVSMEDSDEPSDAVDVIVSKPGSKRGG